MSSTQELLRGQTGDLGGGLVDVQMTQLPVEPGEDVRGIFSERVQLAFAQPYGCLRFLKRRELFPQLILTRAGPDRGLHRADQRAGGGRALQHGHIAQRPHREARQFRQLVVPAQNNGGNVGPGGLAAERLEH